MTDHRFRSRIRVAHVGNYQMESTSGVDKTLAGLVSRLPEYGLQVEVWQFTTTVTEVCERDVKSICVVDLPAHSHPRNFLCGLTRPARVFVRERQHAVDLVHFHSVFIPENVCLAARLGVPYVLTPNGGYNLRVLQGHRCWYKAFWLRLYETKYIRRASLLHAVSLPERQALMRRFRDVPVLYVPNAVDLPDATDIVEDVRGLPTKDLLFLGRLAVEHKGLDRLLRGYARFLQHTGDQSTRLILTGPDFRGGQEVIDRLRRSLGISKRVSLTGPVFGDEKWALLRGAYTLICPSRWEGMPFAVLEALAVGCPVLITPETNLGDIVAAYNAGVVVTGNSLDIARGLELLVSMTQDRYLAMRHEARQLVADHYTWARGTERIAQAYQKIIEGLAHA